MEKLSDVSVRALNGVLVKSFTDVGITLQDGHIIVHQFTSKSLSPTPIAIFNTRNFYVEGKI